MPPYEPKYPIGSEVVIETKDNLDRFRRTWKFHNPLSIEQIGYAEKRGRISKVGFYHGGDPLYELDGIPGVWHEECLRDGAAR